jgi:arylformamidase
MSEGVERSQPVDLEAEYNPRVTVSDPQRYFDRAVAASLRARAELECEQDVRYGPGRKMVLDVFPAGEGTPVHVFVHGGFWRGRDKSDYSFLAQTLTPRGITTVVPNYDLCPEVSVRGIVRQTVDLLRWIRANRQMLGGAPRIVASGHSAGAHLLAMAHAEAFPDSLSTAPIDHAILISGIYNLEPVLSISVNSEIRLSREEALEMSPMQYPPTPALSLDVLVGGSESRSWIDQSQRFAEVASRPGRKVTCRILEAHNHYSVMEDAMDPGSELSRLLISRTVGIGDLGEG